MKIAANTVVSMRYKMRNSKGDVLEDIQGEAPIEYLHGAGKILPQLEAALNDLVVGDRKEISISGGAGYEVDDKFCLNVIVDKVREATAEEIKQGYPNSRVAVPSCGPGGCC